MLSSQGKSKFFLTKGKQKSSLRSDMVTFFSSNCDVNVTYDLIGLGVPPAGLSVREADVTQPTKPSPATSTGGVKSKSSVLEVNSLVASESSSQHLGQTPPDCASGLIKDQGTVEDNLRLGEEAHSAPLVMPQQPLALAQERSATVASLQSDGGSSSSNSALNLKSNIIGEACVLSNKHGL